MDKLQTPDWIAIIMGLAAVVVALIALGVAIYAIYRGNRNTSAATLVTLNVAFRDAWERFLNASDENRQFHFAELMNLFEITCAIHHENSLAGVSAHLIRSYMDHILVELIENDYANVEITELLVGANTFAHIRKFVKAQKDSLSVTVPPKWYETQVR